MMAVMAVGSLSVLSAFMLTRAFGDDADPALNASAREASTPTTGRASARHGAASIRRGRSAALTRGIIDVSDKPQVMF